MPAPLAKQLGKIIRKRREEACLSQEDLGTKTNLSRNYIGMVERGETNLTILVLQSLAEALGTTMTSLISQVEKGK